MKRIRKGIFETNSSSTHALCITKDNDNIEIPKTISINIDEFEFGWSYEEWDSAEDKIAYFILGILNISYNEGIGKGATILEEFINDLKEFGIEKIDIEGIRFYHYENQYYFESEGYVDHASELLYFIKEMMANKESLKRFLFSRDSFILGGNDNDEGYPEIKVDYDHEVYYKGN